MASPRRALLVICALVVLAAAACVGSNPGGQQIASTKDRKPPNGELLGGAVAANNAFAIDFYRAVAAGRGNFVYSPYALLTALAMVRAGSGPSSDTRAQMDAVLHAPTSTDLDAGLNTIGSTLQTRNGEKRSDTRIGKVSLEFAAAVWGQRGTHVKEDYLDLLAENYGTGVHVVDFRSDAEAARQAINAWAHDATKGQIEEIASRGDVTPYTRLLIAAESNVQAPWLIPFDPTKTKSALFQRADDPPVDVRMMQASAPVGLRYASTGGWTAVELPYLGDELEFDVLMPAAGTMATFEQELTAQRLDEIIQQLHPQAIDLRLPQFQFETSTNLNEMLKPAMANPFSTEADFSGITSDEMLSISEVVTKGFFGVNEQGTNPANTATAQPGATPAVSGALPLSVDRPFVFIVRDRQTGVVLVIGRVMNPA